MYNKNYKFGKNIYTFKNNNNSFIKIWVSDVMFNRRYNKNTQQNSKTHNVSCSHQHKYCVEYISYMVDPLFVQS